MDYLCMFFLLSPCVPEREAGVEKRSDVIRVSPKDVVDNRRLLEKRTPRDFTGRIGFSNSARVG